MCYKLLKNTIKEYRPNELYASQWLDMLIYQAIISDSDHDILAEPTLTELIDNNQRILENKISKEITHKFINMLLEESTSERFVNILRAIITCNGEAVIRNQAEISRILFEDINNKKALVYEIDVNAQGMIDIYITQLNTWIPLTEFLDFSEKKDHEHKGLFDYFISFIHLCSDLCLSRNYIAINQLELIYTYDICFKIFSLPNSNDSLLQLTGAFARLLNHLWIDKSPYEPLKLPNLLILWDELNENSASKIPKSTTYDGVDLETLKKFVLDYLVEISGSGFSCAAEKVKNTKTLHVVDLAK